MNTLWLKCHKTIVASQTKQTHFKEQVGATKITFFLGNDQDQEKQGVVFENRGGGSLVPAGGIELPTY